MQISRSKSRSARSWLCVPPFIQFIGLILALGFCMFIIVPLIPSDWALAEHARERLGGRGEPEPARNK